MRYSGRKSHKKSVIICLIGAIVVLGGLVTYNWMNQHFAKGTIIQGVDCSRLTVEKARETIEEELQNLDYIVVFEGEEEYHISGEKIQIQVTDTYELEEILENQHDNKEISKTYNLEHTLSFEQKNIEDFLQKIFEDLKENGAIIESENAFLTQNEKGTVEIVPEVYGNEPVFSKALDYVVEQIKLNQTCIDLKSVQKENPKVTSNLLESRMNQINAVLLTTVQFKLYAESAYTLDINLMKDWVKQDEKANLHIDIDKGIANFIDELVKKAAEASKEIWFNATGIESVTLNVPKNKRDSINKQATTECIKTVIDEALSTQIPQNCTMEPVYIKNIESNLKKYLEVDITRQTVWFYKEGQCILETPCVTGDVSEKHNTPTGIYVLDSKQTNATLRGRESNGSTYSSFVHYWMPFFGGYGLHDALWRSQSNGFGGNIYKNHGSHGCVNLPLSAAKKIYENIDFDTWIIIYES